MNTTLIDDDDKENVDYFNHYYENEDTKSKETVKDLVIETVSITPIDTMMHQLKIKSKKKAF